MNCARLITYEQVRSGIQAYTEARRSQVAFKTVATKNTSDPMEVDSFGGGGKKGKKGKKGDGKSGKRKVNIRTRTRVQARMLFVGTAVRKGDLSTEGWSNPKNQSGSGGTQNEGGKGKPENVTGKEASSLEQGGFCAHKEGLKYGDGVTCQGRKADVYKTLISASKVHSKGHVAVVDSNGGHIIPYNSTLARRIQQLVQEEIVKELGAIRLYLENGTHIGYTQIQQHGSTRRDQELCSKNAKHQPGCLRHSRRWSVPWQTWVRLTAALLRNRQ